MKSLRLIVLGALAAAVIAASAGASSQQASAPPVAQAAGGDVTVSIIPSLVNTRLVRAQRLLDKAAEYQDLGDDANAVKALASLRTNLAKAWLGDKFLILNAPPPVVVGDSTYVGPATKARASGAPVGNASPYADYYVTTGALLAFQHTVATTALSLLDSASAAVLAALNTTVFAALNARDTTIAYVHSLPVPPPPAGLKVAPAHASGAPVATSGWSTTMQAILFDTDDELMELDGLRDAGSISASRARLLDLAEAQISKSARNVNRFWPPLPAAG